MVWQKDLQIDVEMSVRDDEVQDLVGRRSGAQDVVDNGLDEQDAKRCERADDRHEQHRDSPEKGVRAHVAEESQD
jgi:hypothetical protein